MFGGDDDDDFTPASSSKLASLFGLGKSSQEGNTSLTYTAPKQPKKGRPESQSAKGQNVEESTSSPAKLSIIAVKAVHTYKLADGNYNAQGKLGAAVLGNLASRVYQLLLYKGKQQHVTSTRITPTFQFVVQANNYATFYDDQMQNWSVMFESSEDAIDFAREVGLARANAMGDKSVHNFIAQDLLFGVGSGASEGDSVEIRYVVFSLSAGKLGQEVENTTKLDKPHRVKLKKDGWEEGLLGMAKGCKRMIVLPSSLAGPWKSKVPTDAGVVLEVGVGRIKSASKSIPQLTDSGESAVDSSTDDTSIKARGASISEALTNSPKTHKASIIFRMARMGQATLPLKGAIACNPSDSEETEEELSGPGDAAPSLVNKAPVKVRLAKSRPVSSAPQEKPVHTVTMASSVAGGILPQQVAMYQPLTIPWQQPSPQPQQQFMRTNGSMTYVQSQGQLYPLMAQQAVSTQQVFPTTVSSPPAVPSPDSHLSVFLAETRTQNSEVRMGMAKVADKVDQVMLKLDSLHHRQSLPNVVGVMEPSTLLASVQKLVSENEQLRTELGEKREKIDQQNEKIYQLLHLNQKYLEQSNSMMEQRQEAPLQTLVLTLQHEKAKLAADLNEAISRASSLEFQVATAEQEVQSRLTMQQTELDNNQHVIQEQEQRFQALHLELQTSSKSLTEVQILREQLEKKVQLLQEEASNCEQRMSELVKSHQTEIVEFKSQQQSSSNTVQHEKEWTRKLAAETEDVKTKNMGIVRGLEQEKEALWEKVRNLQTQLQEVSSGTGDVKNVMNLVYRMLQPQFVSDSFYDGTTIRQTLMATIRDVTLKYIEMKSSSEKVESMAEKPSKGHPQELSYSAAKSDKVELPDEAKVSSDTNVKTRPCQEKCIEEKLSASEKTEPLGKADPDVPSLKDMAPPQTRNSVEKPAVQGAGSLMEEPQSEKSDLTRHPVGPTGDVASSHAVKGKDKQSRESSLERSWRPQPPPPPLFDDDDEDDDWLS